MKVKLAACLRAVSSCCRCPVAVNRKPVKLVLTTGFRYNEIFRLEGRFLHPSRADGLSGRRSRIPMKGHTGPRIWEVKEGEEGFDKLKNKVPGNLRSRLRTLLVDRRGNSADPSGEEMVAAAAEEYYASLNDCEREDGSEPVVD